MQPDGRHLSTSPPEPVPLWRRHSRAHPRPDTTHSAYDLGPDQTSGFQDHQLWSGQHIYSGRQSSAPYDISNGYPESSQRTQLVENTLPFLLTDVQNNPTRYRSNFDDDNSFSTRPSLYTFQPAEQHPQRANLNDSIVSSSSPDNHPISQPHASPLGLHVDPPVGRAPSAPLQSLYTAFPTMHSRASELSTTSFSTLDDSCSPSPRDQKHHQFRILSDVQPTNIPDLRIFVYPSSSGSSSAGKGYDYDHEADSSTGVSVSEPSSSSDRMQSFWPSSLLRKDSADLSQKQSDSPRGSTPESDSVSLTYLELSPSNSSTRNVSFSSELSTNHGNPSKKRSKKHECVICHKTFPRPSGLRTHMNAHNGVKPFACDFPECRRKFTVRSNAKRHLRTHGVVFESLLEPPPAQYNVGFETPVVSHQAPQHDEGRPPLTLRWIPQSLTTRTNANALRSSSEYDSSSENDDRDRYDDDVDDVRGTSLCSVLSIPLRAVVPSVPTLNPIDQYEERNSYIQAGSYPYHPSQWRGLPGPVSGNRITI